MSTPQDHTPLLLGVVCAAAGMGIIGVAADVIAVDPSSIHAPRWVLGLCGAVFAFGGLAVILPQGSAAQSAAGGSIVLAFGVIGGWVALFGDAAQFSGGLPFVPAALNVALARGMFGLGSVLCLALFAWGTWRLLRGEPSSDDAR